MKRPKSRTQIAKEKSGVVTDDGFVDAVDTFNRAEVERKIFRNIDATMLDAKTNRYFAMDEDTGGMCECGSPVPNGPVYLGFHQPAPHGKYGFATDIPEQILRHYGDRNFFIGFQACALLATHNFISKACSMPGDDAIAAGWSFRPRKKDRKLVEHLTDFVYEDDFDIERTILKFEFNKRCFGFALAFPCFEEDVDMSTPLKDYDQFKHLHFRGWNVIDPYWIQPDWDEFNKTDPADYNFYRPTWWRVLGTGKRIHYSWCIYQANTIVADILRPSYYWGGVSIPQMCFERCYAADKCANEAQMLAMSKRLLVMTANTKKMAANPQYAMSTMNALKYNRDNWGILPVPVGTEVKQIDSMLTEFNQLITTQYQLFCGIVEVPAPKMVMSPLTGFANSGQYEWKVYAANLKKIQTRDMNPILKATAKIVQACEVGAAFKPVDIEFGEIDIPTLVEQAEIAYEQSRAEKFSAEAEAVSKMSRMKSAETHKTAQERIEETPDNG